MTRQRNRAPSLISPSLLDLTAEWHILARWVYTKELHICIHYPTDLPRTYCLMIAPIRSLWADADAYCPGLLYFILYSKSLWPREIKTSVKETKHFKNALLVPTCKWSIVLGEWELLLFGVLLWYDLKPSVLPNESIKWYWWGGSAFSLPASSCNSSQNFFTDWRTQSNETAPVPERQGSLRSFRGQHKAEVESNHIRSSTVPPAPVHFRPFALLLSVEQLHTEHFYWSAQAAITKYYWAKYWAA